MYAQLPTKNYLQKHQLDRILLKQIKYSWEPAESGSLRLDGKPSKFNITYILIWFRTDTEYLQCVQRGIHQIYNNILLQNQSPYHVLTSEVVRAGQAKSESAFLINSWDVRIFGNK